MPELKYYFKEILRDAKKLAVLGAGSVLRSDDAAGVLVAEKLMKKLGGNETPGILVLNGSSAPENFTGEIKRFSPDHVFIIDAADIGAPPGSISVIDPQVIGGVSFSTHMLPMKVMVEYLRQEVGCPISVIGIQPVNLDFGEEVTSQVQSAVDDIVGMMLSIFSTLIK